MRVGSQAATVDHDDGGHSQGTRGIELEGVWVPEDHEANTEPWPSHFLTLHQTTIDFILLEPLPSEGCFLINIGVRKLVI